MTLIYSDARHQRRRVSPPPRSSRKPPTRDSLPPPATWRAQRSRTSSLRFRIRRFLRTRVFRIIILIWAVYNVFDLLRVHHNAKQGLAPPDRTARPKERIYIASMHWNNGRVLKERWNDAVVALAEALGPENVFVSVYESGSWDDTKDALRMLDAELEKRGVPRNVTLSDVTHKDEMAKEPAAEGWIDTPRGKKELRRIPYLAALRNRTLKDLIELSALGTHFDKVLFLNDVVFTTEDVYHLLDTNGGRYAAACSLDFSKPPDYYDTFALRDSNGHGHVMQQWPYFKSSGSRRAMLQNIPAVPVKSCWNGLVAMPASPFVAEKPLRFRGIDDSLAKQHLEGSECCLIHADNPLSSELGVYLNPHVRVGYNVEAYTATHPSSGSWLSTWQIVRGLWLSKVLRWVKRTESIDWVVSRRVKQWESEAPGVRREPGEFCLINEMQVLVENGWKHL